MTVLSVSQRRVLSDVVVRARDLVEVACAQRVASLGVVSERSPEGLSEADRRVRVGLRARARQLGSVEALVAEAAFEHWHQMLFARFLVDNGLLVDDAAGMPVSAAELAEWASELGMDRWQVAARFASAMLPGIFRVDDPVLEMQLPVEIRHGLERLLGELPVEVVTADDALGWVYQYWQAKRKDEVNRSERKIGGADLAPVTQLFTEDYMVRFLLENSLGAWWAARHPQSPLVEGWDFLRRAEDGSPAAGSFAEWPASVAAVTVMDPCCGSGHFLVAAFEMLWRMRAEEEGLPVAAAQDAVLRDNLFGLELDARCTQIAIFALALSAWRSGGYRDLPLPQVACSGIPARAPLSDWTVLADGDERVEAALARLHALFVNADTLGSLIDPVRASEQAGLESVDWHEVAPLVQQALTAEAGRHGDDPTAAVFGQAAAGIARAADYLSRTYTLVTTNPPYLGRGGQAEDLARFLGNQFPRAAADLATAFMERGLCAAQPGGAVALVLPHNWLFLAGYEEFRRWALTSHGWRALVRLGSSAFSAISGEVVKAALVVLEVAGPDVGCAVLDVSSASLAAEKAVALKSDDHLLMRQAMWLQVPAATLITDALPAGDPLGTRCKVYEGLKPGQTTRVTRYFWEIPRVPSDRWVLLCSSPDGDTPYSGMSEVGSHPSWLSRHIPESNTSGRGAWGQPGVLIAKIGSLKASLFTGEVFDNNTFAIIPRSQEDLLPLWAMVVDGELSRVARLLNQKLDVSQRTIEAVPFDVERWRAVAAERFPGGLPEPWSGDPTQWLFRGEVMGAREPLQVAVARLLGFRWPDQEPDALDEWADGDGVVCLPAVGGEVEGTDRLRRLLEAAYGGQWSPAVLDGLLVDVGAKPGLAGLQKWLRNGFFKDHCRVFANRPFVWQVWDGTPTGFSALVNYHRLDRKLLERLTHDYLGNWWMSRVREEVRGDVPGAETRLKAAQDLKDRLELILAGEPPYDIYVRWKDLHEQPIGWEPDLDDGVRLNIRPFVAAGVLRHQPKIKWDKDRGKDPNGRERLNDLHYSTEHKRRARGGGVA